MRKRGHDGESHACERSEYKKRAFSLGGNARFGGRWMSQKSSEEGVLEFQFLAVVLLILGIPAEEIVKLRR